MRIGVIGACAWGTALAQVAAANGDPVLIWAFEEEVARAINETHCNRVFLPGNDLNSAIQATTSLDDLSVCDAVLVVTPAQHLGAILGHAPVGNLPLILRSEARRVRKECVSTCTSRWSPYP